MDIASALLAALGVLAAASGVLNRVLEIFKPRIQAVAGENYNTLMRVVSVLLGLVIVGFAPQLNIFEGPLGIFYGYNVPQLAGAIITGVLIGGGSNLWYELGQVFNRPPATEVLVIEQPNVNSGDELS